MKSSFLLSVVIGINAFLTACTSVNQASAVKQDPPVEHGNITILYKTEFDNSRNQFIFTDKLDVKPGENGKEATVLVSDNATRKIDYITMAEFSRIPSGLLDFKYGVSIDNRVILFKKEGNIIKVAQENNGNFYIGSSNGSLLNAISNGQYTLIEGIRTPDGRIKIKK